MLQAFTYILPLLTLPYLVRVLGAETFGLVMFAQAFIMFFNILVDFGFSLSATREISINRDNPEKLTEIFSSVMSIKIILILLSVIILSLIIFTFDKFSKDWELYYLTFLWVIGQALFPIWYFQGIENMKYITIVNIVSKVIFTALIFVVVQDESDYLYVPLVNGLGFIIGALLSLWIIFKNLGESFKIYSFLTLKKYFYDSAQFFLSRVSVSIYTSSNTFVLGLLTNNTMVGYYSIAEKLYLALQSFYTPIVQVLYPYVAKERNIQLFKKVFYSVIVINTLGIIFLFFTGSYIFNLLFTTSIGAESIQVFNIFLIAGLIIVPSIMIGYPYLAALGFSRYPNMSVVYASIFHIFGLALLWSFNSVTIYSVATLVIGTQIVDLVYRIYGIKKYTLWNNQQEGKL